MTGPTPKISVRLVPEALTAAASFFLVSRSWASRRRMSARNSAGQLAARLRRPRPDGVTCSRMRAAWPAVISLRDAAGDQVAQHRMQPAGDLVAGPGQVPVPLGPHLQHRGVILGAHLAPGRGPQRRDRHRAGIVRVVLVRVPGLQQPHPGSQLGRHVQHPLTGGDQLLGQQVAQPAGALHRPGPLRPRPPPTPAALAPGPGRHAPAARPAAPPPRRSPPRCASPYAGRSRSSLPPSAHSRPSSPEHGGPRRACLIPDCWRSRLFRATPRRGPTGWHLVLKPGRNRGRQAVREPARRASRTLRQTPQRQPRSQLDDMHRAGLRSLAGCWRPPQLRRGSRLTA